MRIFILAFLTLLSTSLLAQIHFGIQAGPVGNEYFGDEDEELKFLYDVGFTAGFVAEWRVNKDLILGTELSYLEENGGLAVFVEEADTSYFVHDSLKISIRSLDVPLYFQLVSKNDHWFGTGGADLIFPFKLLDTKSDTQYNDLLRGVNLGVLVGVGYQTDMWNWGRVKFEIRYSQSLQPITKSNERVLSRLKSTRNLFKLTYILPLNRS